MPCLDREKEDAGIWSRGWRGRRDAALSAAFGTIVVAMLSVTVQVG
jgi:hypothetical protein